MYIVNLIALVRLHVDVCPLDRYKSNTDIFTRGVQKIRGQMLPFPEFLTEQLETFNPNEPRFYRLARIGMNRGES